MMADYPSFFRKQLQTYGEYTQQFLSLQAGKMREARGLGIKLGGLGFGFPSSMTDQHTNIMRTMTKPRSTASFRIA